MAQHGERDRRRVVAATSISYVVVIPDTSIVNVALERIASDLGTDITGLQWVVNAARSPSCSAISATTSCKPQSEINIDAKAT
jgi:hypothetical protein